MISLHLVLFCWTNKLIMMMMMMKKKLINAGQGWVHCKVLWLLATNVTSCSYSHNISWMFTYHRLKETANCVSRQTISWLLFTRHFILCRFFLARFLLGNFNWTPWNRIVIARRWICIGIIVAYNITDTIVHHTLIDGWARFNVPLDTV